jgi:hypothetical protein
MVLDPVSLTLIGTAILAIAVITFKKIIRWFSSKSHLTQQNADAVGVLIARKMDNRLFHEVDIGFSNSRANTQIVKAVYDERTGEVLTAEAEESRNAPDEETRRAIRAGKGMVVFR